MNRYFAIAYGTISYALFLVVFVYTIGFVGGLVLRSVDHAIVAPVGQAVAADVLLLTLFAVQHSQCFNVDSPTVPMLVPGLCESSLASPPQR
jgi:protein-S-isoprenylcysteine O-methyltransferase Ste14